MTEDAAEPVSGLVWWWLSFSSVTWRGSTVIPMYVEPGTGERTRTAAVIKEAWRLGLNPGGEVLTMPVCGPFAVPEGLVGNLHTDRAKLDQLLRDWTGQGIVVERRGPEVS